MSRFLKIMTTQPYCSLGQGRAEARGQFLTRPTLRGRDRPPAQVARHSKGHPYRPV